MIWLPYICRYPRGYLTPPFLDCWAPLILKNFYYQFSCCAPLIGKNLFSNRTLESKNSFSLTPFILPILDVSVNSDPLKSSSGSHRRPNRIPIVSLLRKFILKFVLKSCLRKVKILFVTSIHHRSCHEKFVHKSRPRRWKFYLLSLFILPSLLCTYIQYYKPSAVQSLNLRFPSCREHES